MTNFNLKFKNQLPLYFYALRGCGQAFFDSTRTIRANPKKRPQKMPERPRSGTFMNRNSQNMSPRKKVCAVNYSYSPKEQNIQWSHFCQIISLDPIGQNPIYGP